MIIIFFFTDRKHVLWMWISSILYEREAEMPALSHYIASPKNVLKKEKIGVNYGEYKKLRFLN